MANTGRARYREQDQNPQSPTYGELRWSAYENNTAACPLPQQFFSEAVSGYTTKNDCAAGQTGTQVYFSVPAGYANSPTSQAEAQAVADAYYQNQRQAYANQNGTCQSTQPARRVSITNYNERGDGRISVTAQRTDNSAALTLQLRFVSGSGQADQYAEMVLPAGAIKSIQTLVLTSPPAGQTQTLDIVSVEIIGTDPADYQY